MVHYAFVVKLNIRKMIPYEAMKPNFEYLMKKNQNEYYYINLNIKQTLSMINRDI